MNSLDNQLSDVGKPIVVATHPRSGTHLTIDFLRKQFEACKGWLRYGETLHHLYLSLDRLSPRSTHPVTIEEAIGILRRPERPTLKTHSLPTLPNHEGQRHSLAERLLDTGDVIYVVRDGRDVLCSTYAWRAEEDCSLSDFIRQRKKGRTRVEYWVEHVRQWTNRSDVTVLQFENILSRPRSVIDQLSTTLELSPLYDEPFLPRPIKSDSRWRDYWRRLTRNYESTTIVGRSNGKERPDWEEAFTREDRTFFWEEAGSALREFGYETDDKWISEPAGSHK